MIVLDASAVVDVVLDQPHGSWVLDQLAADTDVVAPAHQTAEVLSAIARVVRTDRMTARAGAAALADAGALAQHLVQPSRAHVRRAFELRGRIRVVDGLYVALAEELACPLITTDRRLERSSPPCAVRSPVDA
ncbi:MAG: type II toxin-antitoxin system VapC family toxin [Angustibacter sp.]